MRKERWIRIGKPVPVSMEYPCEIGDVVSQYGGFNTSLVLKVDSDGIPIERLSMKGREIVIDEEIRQNDDGQLYHTDRVSTEEEWRMLAGYAHWKTNEAMRWRIWERSERNDKKREDGGAIDSELESSDVRGQIYISWRGDL